MNLSFVFHIEPITLNEEVGYVRLEKLLKALASILGISTWFKLPKSREESKRPWLPFLDREAFVNAAKLEIEKRLKEWPENPLGFQSLLCSAHDEASYRANKAKGRCELSFSPGRGRIQLDVIKPDEAWPDRDLTAWARGVVQATVVEEWVEFANVDVSQAPRRDGVPGEDVFSIDFRTFPHRQFLGWMGFIQRLPPTTLIKPEDIPQAAKVIPLPARSGALIVSVGEKFDVHNPLHIMQAQKVEMRLVDLDALPVIDPGFI